MATYYCYECDTHKNDDYFPCEVHPKYDTELVCPDCMMELQEEDTPQVRQNGRFTSDQLAIIKQLEAEADDDGI